MATYMMAGDEGTSVRHSIAEQVYHLSKQKKQRLFAKRTRLLGEYIELIEMCFTCRFCDFYSLKTADQRFVYYMGQVALA